MKFTGVMLLALCAAPAMAFSSVGKVKSFSPAKAMARGHVSMSLDVNKAAVATMAAAPVFAAQAVMATEGTGEAWGIDDGRLTFVLAAGFTFVFFLFNAWSGQQDDDDFFDSIERRSSK